MSIEITIKWIEYYRGVKILQISSILWHSFPIWNYEIWLRPQKYVSIVFLHNVIPNANILSPSNSIGDTKEQLQCWQ
jgi:hypothetical protein